MRQALSSRRLRGRAASLLALGASLALLAAAALPASADEAGVVLSDAWMRSVIPLRPAAGYFMLKNETGKDQDRLGRIA